MAVVLATPIIIFTHPDSLCTQALTGINVSIIPRAIITTYCISCGIWFIIPFLGTRQGVVILTRWKVVILTDFSNLDSQIKRCHRFWYVSFLIYSAM